MALDRIDLNILERLQTNSAITNLVLAGHVGLSPPACLKRVKRLFAEGYIEREVALLNQQRFEPCLHMVIEVEMERDRIDLYQQFLQRVLQRKEVKQCYQVTGEVDFILIVTVADMRAYDSFCQEALYAEPNMRKFRTLISRQRHKFDTSIHLTPPQNS